MFNKLKYALARFMYGRYGADSLYKGLLILYVVLLVVNIFLDSKIISILMYGVLLWLIFRMMSKNHIARAKENRAFLKLISPFSRFFSVNAKRIKDIKTKRYRVCKHCKATIRLPIKKGKHTVICPKCQKKLTVRILF